jgi:hypothetical protein
VLVHLDQIARFIANANHRIMRTAEKLGVLAADSSVMPLK